MKNKTSILQKVIQDIYDCDSYISAKKLFIDTIESSRINPANKLKMIGNVNDIEQRYDSDKSRLQALQVYATNSMFDKLGMNTRRW